jgi:transaldolase
MRIFLDTANVASIQKWGQTGLIDGVTTNPTHLSKEGGDPKKVVLEICALLPHGEISVEVTEEKPEAVYKQAKIIAALAPNVLVKVPCHKQYYLVIKRLVDEGVKLNITLVFTLVQGLIMCKLGVQYISPFVGRLDDIEAHGIQLLYDMRHMIDMNEFKTKILAASLRHERHVHDAILAGVDAITVPIDVFEKCLDHPLTDKGMATFLADWKKLGVKQFP